jgi:hypothetical protein
MADMQGDPRRESEAAGDEACSDYPISSGLGRHHHALVSVMSTDKRNNKKLLRE